MCCSGGADLYEAAVLLKEVLRGRVALLIQDRIDIVGAAEADGVILSARGVHCAWGAMVLFRIAWMQNPLRAAGIPTVVARRSLRSGVDLVGRRVTSGPDAQRAAADGANLVILEVR